MYIVHKENLAWARTIARTPTLSSLVLQSPVVQPYSKAFVRTLLKSTSIRSIWSMNLNLRLLLNPELLLKNHTLERLEGLDDSYFTVTYPIQVSRVFDHLRQTTYFRQMKEKIVTWHAEKSKK